jgi:hypothetical protein
MCEGLLSSLFENPIPIGLFCILLWLILKKTPETIIGPIKKFLLFVGMLLLIKLICLADNKVFIFIQDSGIGDLIRNTFDKSDEWLEGIIDGLFLIIGVALYGYLISLEFSSKKAKK